MWRYHILPILNQILAVIPMWKTLLWQVGIYLMCGYHIHCQELLIHTVLSKSSWAFTLSLGCPSVGVSKPYTQEERQAGQTDITLSHDACTRDLKKTLGKVLATTQSLPSPGNLRFPHLGRNQKDVLRQEDPFPRKRTGTGPARNWASHQEVCGC